MPIRRGRTDARRRRPASVAGALLALILAGCAPTPSPDPALVAMAEDALSLTRTAVLNVGLDADGRIFATTSTVVLGEMEEGLAAVAREAQLHDASGVVDAEFRAELLELTRSALDAVAAAERGEADAGIELEQAADGLEKLADQP